MKITFWSKSDARICFSFEFCVHGTEIQPSRTRFCHVADIWGVAEDASTYFPIVGKVEDPKENNFGKQENKFAENENNFGKKYLGIVENYFAKVHLSGNSAISGKNLLCLNRGSKCTRIMICWVATARPLRVDAAKILRVKWANTQTLVKR